MSWVELFAVLAVCHMVGDFVVQTNWQATHKRGGLGGERDARRALASHIATYTLTFVPALVWIGEVRGAGAAVGVAAAIAFPHLIQDDGRLLRSYMRSVKHIDPDDQLVAVLVDQAFHAVVLLVTALIVAS